MTNRSSFNNIFGFQSYIVGDEGDSQNKSYGSIFGNKHLTTSGRLKEISVVGGSMVDVEVHFDLTMGNFVISDILPPLTLADDVDTAPGVTIAAEASTILNGQADLKYDMSLFSVDAVLKRALTGGTNNAVISSKFQPLKDAGYGSATLLGFNPWGFLLTVRFKTTPSSVLNLEGKELYLRGYIEKETNLA